MARTVRPARSPAGGAGTARPGVAAAVRRPPVGEARPGARPGVPMRRAQPCPAGVRPGVPSRCAERLGPAFRHGRHASRHQVPRGEVPRAASRRAHAGTGWRGCAPCPAVLTSRADVKGGSRLHAHGPSPVDAVPASGRCGEAWDTARRAAGRAGLAVRRGAVPATAGDCGDDGAAAEPRPGGSSRPDAAFRAHRREAPRGATPRAPPHPAGGMTGRGPTGCGTGCATPRWRPARPAGGRGRRAW